MNARERGYDLTRNLMLPEERSAARTMAGLAHEIQFDIDFSCAMAFERAAKIGEEIANAAQLAIEARGEEVFRSTPTTGIITRAEIESARKESAA